jgi:hypothetical protein
MGTGAGPEPVKFRELADQFLEHAREEGPADGRVARSWLEDEEPTDPDLAAAAPSSHCARSTAWLRDHASPAHSLMASVEIRYG